MTVADHRVSPGGGPFARSSAPGHNRSPRRPLVARSGYARPPLGLIVGVAAFGLVTFCILSGHRSDAGAARPVASQGADAEALANPATPSPELSALQSSSASATPQPVNPQAPPAPSAPVLRGISEPSPATAGPVIVHEPLLVFDGGVTASSSTAPSEPASAREKSSSPNPPSNADADEQFAARIQDEGAAPQQSATRLKNLSMIIAQGTIISAVLETALNSDLPGFARAVVSRDVLSFNGSTILIPKGSRLVGEYKSGLSVGQSRAYVIWTRVLRPDGGSIMIDSGGGDRLGRSGLSGDVDRHFFERFSGAILLTILNAGANAVSNRPSTEVVVGSPQAAAPGVATTGSANISPTVKVAQGAPVRVFVAHDLDFTGIETTR